MTVAPAPSPDMATRGSGCLGLAQLPAPPAHKTGWPWTAESARLPAATATGLAWPRVTVVTPSYNQAAFLEAAIRSVLLQGYPNLEYMVIDGGSTDGSVEILRKYTPWLSCVMSEPDGGQYDAINKGFKLSTGTVMTWLNSDDMCAPNSLWAVGSIFSELGVRPKSEIPGVSSGRTPFIGRPRGAASGVAANFSAAPLGNRVHWITGLPAMWDRDDHLGLVLPRPNLNRSLLRLGAYDGVTLNFIQQEGTFWTRDLWVRAGGALDTSLELAADYELWCRLAEHAQLYGASVVLAGSRRHPDQKTAHAMQLYMAEMARCRAARPWKLTEKHWLSRGIKRRLARFICRADQSENRILYDPSRMCWTIH